MYINPQYTGRRDSTFRICTVGQRQPVSVTGGTLAGVSHDPLKIGSTKGGSMSSEKWKACTRASNKIADLMCAIYCGNEPAVRRVMPIATLAEIIASELGIDYDSADAPPTVSSLADAVLEWARTPGNHGGNPYCHRFVKLAQRIKGES